MTTASISKHRKPVIRFLIGFSLLLGLTGFVDYDRIVASVSTANRPLLWLGFLLFSAQGLFESNRLKITYAGFNISFLDSVRLFFVGLFFGNFSPGPIGADIYQIYHMHTIKPGLLKPLSLSFFLRLNGLLINLLLAIVVLSLDIRSWMNLINIYPASLTLPNWLVYSILSAFLLMATLVASSQIRSRMHLIYKKLCEVIRGLIELFSAFSFSQHASIAIMGVLVVFSRVMSIYVLVQAFGSTIDGLDVILIVTVSTLAALLPISLGGLGVREISLTALLIAFGVAPSESVAISLIGRCFIWALSLVGGVWFTFHKVRGNTNK